MTLDECYAANQGKALLIPGGGAGNEGQCVQWADTVLHDVYGFDYHWGNAIDWWYSPGELLNHFDQITDGSIKKGDIVVFNSQVGSVYGHIDVAMSDGSTGNFQGADSNWGGNKTVHLVQHSNPSYVLGSFRLKGGNMPSVTGIDEARILAYGVGGRNGVVVDGDNVKLDNSQNALGGSSDRDLNAHHVGRVLDDEVRDWYNSDEGQAWRSGRLNELISIAKQVVPLKAEIADLKKQLANQPSGGIDAQTKVEIDNTNSIVQWIKDKLTSVFK